MTRLIVSPHTGFPYASGDSSFFSLQKHQQTQCSSSMPVVCTWNIVLLVSVITVWSSFLCDHLSDAIAQKHSGAWCLILQQQDSPGTIGLIILLTEVLTKKSQDMIKMCDTRTVVRPSTTHKESQMIHLSWRSSVWLTRLYWSSFCRSSVCSPSQSLRLSLSISCVWSWSQSY